MTIDTTTAQDLLHELAGLHILLSTELDRRGDTGLHERVTGGKGESHPAPLNLDVAQARQAIDMWAFGCAKELIDAETWPKNTPPDTTPDLLRGIAQRTGHWLAAQHPDEAEQFEKALTRLCDKSWVALSPEPSRWRNINIGCVVDKCPGRFKVRLPDMDDGMTHEQRRRAFRDSTPEAVCWITTGDGRERINVEHKMVATLALLSAAS